jgi:hypothetical protein
MRIENNEAMLFSIRNPKSAFRNSLGCSCLRYNQRLSIRLSAIEDARRLHLALFRYFDQFKRLVAWQTAQQM